MATRAPLARVVATLPVATAERAIAAIWGELCIGCEERPAGDDRVHLVVWINGSERDASEAVRFALASANIETPLDVAMEGDEWRDALRRFHQPVLVGERVLVRPPWAPWREGLLDVVIDPGMAFGTGQHATTRACLELLATRTPEGAFLDLGCGSGVLSIAALRLGFSPVRAIDRDPLAVEATRQNACANRLDVDVRTADVLATDLAWAPTVVANLMSELLLQLAPRVDGGVRTMILSGIQEHEGPDVVAAYERRGLACRAAVTDSGWNSFLLERS